MEEIIWKRRIFRVDIGALNLRMATRFLDYLRRHPGVPPKQLVETWNSKVNRPEHCVFVTKGTQFRGDLR